MGKGKVIAIVAGGLALLGLGAAAGASTAPSPAAPVEPPPPPPPVPAPPSPAPAPDAPTKPAKVKRANGTTAQVPADKLALINAAVRLERIDEWLRDGKVLSLGLTAAREAGLGALVNELVAKQGRLEAEYQASGRVGGAGTTQDHDQAETAAWRLNRYLRAAGVRGTGSVEETDAGLRLRATLYAPTADDLVVVRRVSQVDGLDVHVVIREA